MTSETAYYADGSSATGPGPLPDKNPDGALRVTGSGAHLTTKRDDSAPTIPRRAAPTSSFSAFGHHAPSPDQHERIAPVREAAQHLADTITDWVPSCADRTLAFRHLQEVLFFVTTAVESEGMPYIPSS